MNQPKCFKSGGIGNIFTDQAVYKEKLINDVRQALYASKICSYAQGMNLIRAKSIEQGWDLKLGELARIWKGGCISAWRRVVCLAINAGISTPGMSSSLALEGQAAS